MRNIISTIIAAVFFFGLVAILVTPHQKTDMEVSTNSAGKESINPGAVPTVSPTSGVTGTTATTFTLAQVATHKTFKSCWTTINGGVYDVTSWINQHPGGQAAILSLCGIDGSSAFSGQHSGERRPAQELASFKIGVLAGTQTSGGTTGSGTAGPGTLTPASTQTAPISNPSKVYDDD